METEPALAYLVVAYAVFFLLLAGYAARIHHRQRQLEDAVRRLEEHLRRASDAG